VASRAKPAASKRKPAPHGGARPRRRAAAPPALPAADYDAPLHELDRDALSVFLYLALMPEETAELVRELNLSQPGFRQESLGEVQRCDLLADEIRAVPELRARVIALLREGWERPALATWPLSPEPATDLLDACAGDGALALALWRVLCDPEERTRAQARPFLARLAEHYYGPPQDGARRVAPASDASETLRKERDDLARSLEETRQALVRAEARAEAARKKGEEAREKLQAWLKEARAREARAVEEAARARETADLAGRERARVEQELAAARAQDAALEAQRLRGALRDSEARSGALDARLARAQQRERELERDLAAARSAAQLAAVAAPLSADPDTDPEDAPATWLMPVYTREFYDSIQGWDRRIQRAAFKQAALLAQDHRHPSLRALPLEGLPGYYRVRVATDVRLLYRRAERQNTIEILSLIDREDLDRYIKQAKTRAP
jgi:mRNA-degrading endonuclease RelE of RelBE toxin-antitoxin system